MAVTGGEGPGPSRGTWVNGVDLEGAQYRRGNVTENDDGLACALARCPAGHGGGGA